MFQNKSLFIGLAAGFAAALIGGLWQVVTRQATTSTIAAQDLVILRYGIPALLLLPITWRVGLLPRGVATRTLALMAAGAGLPFGVLAMSGTRFAPSAHMGVLMASVSPLFAALFVWLLTRERPAGLRAIGLALMALGAFTLGAKSLAGASAATLPGDALFICAAALWACFSLSFRASGLTAWQGAALVNAWSVLLLVPWLFWRGGTLLLHAPLHDLLFQAAWQGVIAGVLGLWTFAVAIKHL
ncbi:MAG: EamA family transporter, partial [Burkholderiaceae bacterium]